MLGGIQLILALTAQLVVGTPMSPDTNYAVMLHNDQQDWSQHVDLDLSPSQVDSFHGIQLSDQFASDQFAMPSSPKYQAPIPFQAPVPNQAQFGGRSGDPKFIYESDSDASSWTSDSQILEQADYLETESNDAIFKMDFEGDSAPVSEDVIDYGDMKDSQFAGSVVFDHETVDGCNVDELNAEQIPMYASKLLKKYTNCLTVNEREFLQNKANARMPIYYLGQELSALQRDEQAWWTQTKYIAAKYAPREGDHVAFRFKLLHIIGSGAQSLVYEAIDYANGRHVALKIAFTYQAIWGLQQELKMVNQARSPLRRPHSSLFRRRYPAGLVQDFDFIVNTHEPMKSVIRHNGAAVIPYPLLVSKCGSKIPQTAKWTRQLLQALRVLKFTEVVHNDVKPANILYRQYPDGTCDAVLSDFGMAQTRQQAESNNVKPGGTNRFKSPEKRLQITTLVQRPAKWRGSWSYSYSADIFALGMTVFDWLLRLDNGLPAQNTMFHGQTDWFQLGQAVHATILSERCEKLTFEEENVVGLIAHMIIEPLDKRFTVEQALLQHYLNW